MSSAHMIFSFTIQYIKITIFLRYKRPMFILPIYNTNQSTTWILEKKFISSILIVRIPLKRKSAVRHERHTKGVYSSRNDLIQCRKSPTPYANIRTRFTQQIGAPLKGRPENKIRTGKKGAPFVGNVRQNFFPALREESFISGRIIMPSSWKSGKRVVGFPFFQPTY